ncbi:hypothetical protein BDN72DRAFT_904759 [Pluteus cervinus]|uniref:Uncharacterized protein n=1 Tax=Pluteus cervinus TaxID=181527 RepID=A0ACD3A5N6_9AGAR|nr:hypothetical protein BDN72DRAFT_904759 [Pluteus cervinus]
MSIICYSLSIVCHYAYKKYKFSLLRKELGSEGTIEKRLTKAIDSVVEVQDFANPVDVESFVGQVQRLREYHELTKEMVMSHKLSIGDQYHKALNQELENVVLLAQRIVDTAQSVKLGLKRQRDEARQRAAVLLSQPTSTSVAAPEVDKKSLLDRLFKKLGGGSGSGSQSTTGLDSDSDAKDHDKSGLNQKLTESMVDSVNAQLRSLQLDSGEDMWRGDGQCQACLGWQEIMVDVLTESGSTHLLADGSLVSFTLSGHVHEATVDSEGGSRWEADICLNRDYRAACTCSRDSESRA